MGLQPVDNHRIHHRNVNIESRSRPPESAIEGIHKYTIMVKNDPEKVENLVKADREERST